MNDLKNNKPQIIKRITIKLYFKILRMFRRNIFTNTKENQKQEFNVTRADNNKPCLVCLTIFCIHTTIFLFTHRRDMATYLLPTI